MKISQIPIKSLAMNFKDHEKDLRKLLLLPNRRATASTDPKKANNTKPTFYKGIYVLSKNEDDSTHKIGMAHGNGGLFERLKTYKMCFPYKDEFWLQLLIITPISKDAITLEKQVLKSKHFRDIKANDTVQGRRSLEYRITANRQSWNTAILESLNKPRSKNMWSHMIIMNRWGWKIHINDGSTRRGLSKASQDRTTMKGLFGAPDVVVHKVLRTKKPKPKAKVTKVKPKAKKPNFSKAQVEKAIKLSLRATRKERMEKRSKDKA